jgi:hypothetical protein
MLNACVGLSSGHFTSFIGCFEAGDKNYGFLNVFPEILN